MRVARPFVSKPRHPITGKRLRVTGRTQAELVGRLHKLAELREERRLNLITPDELATKLRGLADQRVTLQTAAESYAKQSHLAPKTRALVDTMFSTRGELRYGRPTRGMLADLAPLRLEQLDPPRVAKHFRKLAERVAWSSTRTAWNVLGAVVRHAAEEGWIVQRPWGMWRPSAPTVKKRRPRRECCRNTGERARLLEAARELGDPELVAVIAVAVYLGARKGEIAGLEWRDVQIEEEIPPSFARCVVRLERQGDGRPLKDGELRALEAHELAPYLLEWRQACGNVRGRTPIFPNRRGEHHASDDVIAVERLRAAAARAGLGDPRLWSLHSLRDSFVTIEAQACGSDLRKLAERTGHRSIDSLLRYLQTFERVPRAVPAEPDAPRLPPAV